MVSVAVGRVLVDRDLHRAAPGGRDGEHQVAVAADRDLLLRPAGAGRRRPAGPPR